MDDTCIRLPLDTTENPTMNDNKAFATWALFLIAGSAALMMFIVQVLGAQLPPLLTIAEHVAMGLCVRAAYKYTGGFNWADWSIAGDSADVVAAEEGLEAHPGATAGAMG
jgi:hypothetical protein